MIQALSEHFLSWKTNARRWQISYVAPRLWAIASSHFSRRQVARSRQALLIPPIESEYVSILHDAEFRHSIDQVKNFTCLDFARLANLWTLVRMASHGTFLEVGSFKGGTALHICNAMDQTDSRFYCFDPFELGGFEEMTDLDAAFSPTQFMDTRYEEVVKLLSSKPHATVVRGFFPAAAEGLNLCDIAFCHLDVDIYEASRKSLEYLGPRLSPKGLIVVDDFRHIETPGVEKAIQEFLAKHPEFVAIPMFPCQAVLLPKTFWQT